MHRGEGLQNCSNDFVTGFYKWMVISQEFCVVSPGRYGPSPHKIEMAQNAEFKITHKVIEVCT